MNVKKMILSSMLITNALTIFIIEAQLPPIAPIPGIKLGLANVVTFIYWDIKKLPKFIF